MSVRFAAMSLFAATPIAAAQDAETEAGADTGWTGEGAVSAGVTTGNTDTFDAGVQLDLNRDWGRWAADFDASADYGETDGAATRERYFVSAQGELEVSARLFVFARTTYENDAFSGFEQRFFFGSGLGFDIFKGEKASWSFEGGPGVRVDERADTLADDGSVLIAGETEILPSARGASDFSYEFNENVSFRNSSNAVWTTETTQLQNIASFSSTLTNSLSARVSFEVRHDTNPPDGFENTDTITRFSLVYGFGG